MTPADELLDDLVATIVDMHDLGVMRAAMANAKFWAADEELMEGVRTALIARGATELEAACWAASIRALAGARLH